MPKRRSRREIKEDVLRMALNAIMNCYDEDGKLCEDYGANLFLFDVSKAEWKALKELDDGAIILKQ